MARKPAPKNTATTKPATPLEDTIELPHARGSILSDFTKEGPLLAAEEKLRQACMRGEICKIANKRPSVATDENTIRASFLRYMILGGCEKTPLHARAVRLHGAYIVCRTTEEFGKCLDLESVDILHDLVVDCCRFDGRLILLSTRAKTISLEGSAISSLWADQLSTKGGLFLRENFHSAGEIRIPSVNIGGDLDLKGADLHNDLLMQNAKVRNNTWMFENFKIAGKVNMSNIWIGGNLKCDNAIFTNKDNCIIAKRAVIEGDCDLGSISAKGTVNFNGAKIVGDFTPQGATLLGSPSLQMRGTEIGGSLVWRDLFSSGEVDLGGASCRTINMGKEYWLRKREEYETRQSKKGTRLNQVEEKQNQAELERSANEKPADHTQNQTKLDNFTYQGFSKLPQGCDAEFWIEFLDQQPSDHLASRFRPRPWEQLAGVLHSMGYEAEAKSVRVEKERRLTSFMANYEPEASSWRNGRHWLNVFWRKCVSGPLVDYGYRPGKAILYLIAMILLGSVIYYKAALAGLMTPTHPLIFKEATVNGLIPHECAENWVYFPKDKGCKNAMPSEYSEFQSLIYAADVALPIVNLRMEIDWAPRVVNTDGSRNWFGWWVRTFEWFLIGAGWLLSLLFASAVGGIIRR